MNIIHVIPVLKGTSKESLSYFSSQEFAPGTLVKIPVRNTSTYGIVVKVSPAEELKTELRSSSYSMKKIGSVTGTHVFPRAFIRSAEEAAKYFAGTTGSVLNTLLPKAVLESLESIKKHGTPLSPARTEEHLSSDTVVMQAPDEERLAHYKSIVRETFAQKGSVLFCLPTVHDIRKLTNILPKGIEEYTYIFHSQLPKKEIVKLWEKISSVEHPVLVIGTGSILSIPRHDIKTIIVDRENSSAYKAQSRPYLDIRMFAETYARIAGARCILGGELVRVETLWRQTTGEISELTPLKFRTMTTAKTTVVDMRALKSPLSKEFTLLSPEAEQLIRDTKHNSELAFLFAGRRGIAPTTVCGDCGNVVLCNTCSAPIVLHKNAKGNFFLCHKCGERRSAEERCKVCESWRLVTLGIGVELIHDVIAKRFPELTIFRIDRDTVTTLKKGAAIADTFYESPGSILIGTEMALQYLDRPLDNTAIISLDSLFSIPDFRINEKITSLIVRIRSLATRNFLLQTRIKDQTVINKTIQGNLADVYREELEERKRFEYPPFWTLIKISLRGDRVKVRTEMAHLESYLAPFTVTVFPAFTEIVKGKYIMHGLIRIPKKEWVNEDLLAKLAALPPQFSVNVDPESLL